MYEPIFFHFLRFLEKSDFHPFSSNSLVYTSGQILTFLTTRSISIQNYDFYQDHHLCDRGHRFLIKTIKYWITYTISTEVAKFLNADCFFSRKNDLSHNSESNFVNNNTIVYVCTNLHPFFTFFGKVRFSSIFIKCPWTITSGQILNFLPTRSISIQNYDFYQDHHLCDRGTLIFNQNDQILNYLHDIYESRKIFKRWWFCFGEKTTYLKILSRISWIKILLCMYAPIFIHFLRFLEKLDFHPFSSNVSGL